jgi:hypothetical protein
MISLFFCDECGAANQSDATHCFACQHPLALSSDPFITPVVIQQPQPVHTPPTPINAPSIGTLLNGRYHLLSEIGQGGYGLVYKARDTQKRNRLVAIKQINLSTLSPRQAIEATDTYNREINILSRLQHENLPRIYDSFTDPAHWYVVMEYIEGETLEDYLNKQPGGHLPRKEALKIAIQLTKVLEFLHKQDPPIVFRDVKPGNIMRTPKGRLYLIDFGIARLYDPNKTRDTGPLGSPGYAAPEQYGKAQSTTQTDIYGLGATLQTLLLGDDTDASPTLTLPPRLQCLLSDMLEPDISKRPKNMRIVRDRLERIKRGLAGIVFQFLRVAFWGLVIGSLPYSLLPIGFLAMAIPVVNVLIAVPLSLLLFFLLALWPLYLFGQAVLGFVLLLSKRRWPIGVGILVMMFFILVAQLLGWIHWPQSFLQQIFPPLHFRFT